MADLLLKRGCCKSQVLLIAAKPLFSVQNRPKNSQYGRSNFVERPSRFLSDVMIDYSVEYRYRLLLQCDRLDV